MGPAFRLDVSLTHFLQAIVTDGGGGFEPFFEIAWFDQIPCAVGMVAPHAGEAVGLQFHTDGQGIRVFLRCLTLKAGDFLSHTRQILHVVSHLMRDNIGLREISGGAESLSHFVEEREVEIYLVITRTIKRTDG